MSYLPNAAGAQSPAASPTAQTVIDTSLTTHMQKHMQLTDEQKTKYIGEAPAPKWNSWWNPNNSTKPKEPVPKWDGTNPAKKLKQWLKDLRGWRRDTELDIQYHGRALQQSFDSSGWMRAAADRACPEEKLWTESAWNLILLEILVTLKPFLDVELEVLIEEVVFRANRQAKVDEQLHHSTTHEIP